MRRYRGAGRGGGNFFTILAVVALLGLVVQAAVVLAVAGDWRLIDEPAVAFAAGPAPLAAPPASTVSSPAPAPPTEVSPRPRIRLDLPRLALWPAPAPAAAASPVAATAHAAGPVSPAFIDEYLAGKNSAMIGMGRHFWELGREYDIDPRLLVAISGAETGFGRILTSRYNAFNWFYRGTWDSHFESWAEAIAVVTRGIRRYYLDEGLTTVETLGAKYGPVGAANDPLNLNVNFIPNVTAFLFEMGGNPEHLTFE